MDIFAFRDRLIENYSGYLRNERIGVLAKVGRQVGSGMYQRDMGHRLGGGPGDYVASG